MHQDVERILYTEEELRTRVADLGAQFGDFGLELFFGEKDLFNVRMHGLPLLFLFVV